MVVDTLYGTYALVVGLLLANTDCVESACCASGVDLAVAVVGSVVTLRLGLARRWVCVSGPLELVVRVLCILDASVCVCCRCGNASVGLAGCVCTCGGRGEHCGETESGRSVRARRASVVHCLGLPYCIVAMEGYMWLLAGVGSTWGWLAGLCLPGMTKVTCVQGCGSRQCRGRRGSGTRVW